MLKQLFLVENSILYILETIEIIAIVNRYKLAQVILAETVKRVNFLKNDIRKA